MVLRKLDVSRVFADSPMARCLGPKEMRELHGKMTATGKQTERDGEGQHVRGGTVGYFVDNDVDSTRSCYADLAVCQD